MDIKYYQEKKITKKTNPKEPVKATKEGFVDVNGQVLKYWDFFKSFNEEEINVVATESTKEDLEEVESDDEDNEEE